MASHAKIARSPHRKSSRFKNYTHPLLSETVVYHAAQALGRGFDATADFRLGLVKGSIGSHLVVLDEDQTQNLVTPTGLVIHNVPKDIRLDKGERTRFKSDVLTFNEMSERFNQGCFLMGKMPLGLFNTMYGFNKSWQANAKATKSLALDGWFVTLYSLHLTKSPLLLVDEVKEAVPSIWDPRALARFIKLYGTHIIVGLKVGGKNVVYVRQHQSSPLQLTDIARITRLYADERFEAEPETPSPLEMKEGAGLDKDPDSSVANHKDLRFRTVPSFNTTRVKLKDDVEIICRRRGGDDTVESHYDWIATVADSPDVISMSFVPINSLLEGIPGVGFLSYAINMYLHYKPPIEELESFLEFQLPKQWAPTHEPAVTSPHKENPSPVIQFSLMGPKLYVSTRQVSAGRRPVTGLRLFLEGEKSNKLAVHLQHLSTLPKVLQPYWDPQVAIGASLWKEPDKQDNRWFEPVLWKSFSHVSTCPVECSESWIGATGTYIVTGAQLQIWEFGMKKKVLYLRLMYTKIPGCSIRLSQWDHAPPTAGKSGLLSSLGLSGQLHKSSPLPDNGQVADSLPEGPKKSVSNPKLLKFIDVSEVIKGPEDMPGHWLVSGAKLDIEAGKIVVRVKYSLLHYESTKSSSNSS